MCGVAGYIGEKELPEARLTACRQRMGRRGPDAHGIYKHARNGRHLSLLHSRLKIIDLDDRSNQPFQLDAQVLAFNGEIYNYKELRDQLRQKGQTFQTASDTEVLLKTWMTHGEKGLALCEGMWAFAVYDTVSGRLTLSRDRFGEKPLYIYQNHGDIYFGSEIKFITALLGRPLPLNEPQLYRYLIQGYRSLYKRPETFFTGLTEVAPGTSLTLGPEDRQPRSTRYWSPRFNPVESMTFEEAVQGAREKLMRSVELRLRADVPLAFCMSGGVDSNSLISIAKRRFGFDVHGFTIDNADARYQETDAVRQAVQELGVRHTAVSLSTEGFLDKLRILVRQHDAPVYTISYYVQWLLMEAIAQAGYKISLSGTGADELFSGYFDHHLAYFYDIRSDAALLEHSQAHWARLIQPQVRNPHLRDSRLFFKDPSFREHLLVKTDTFATYLKKSWSEDFIESHYTDSLLRNRMLNELFNEAVPVILHEDDLNAMYYSIENRSPFLDTALFEFCYSIPTRHLIRNGLAKAVLREAMRGIVPDSILNSARKVGFNAPIDSLLDVQSTEVRGMLLDESPIYDFFQKQKIQELLDQPERANSESKFLFNFINAKMFLEEHAKSALNQDPMSAVESAA